MAMRSPREHYRYGEAEGGPDLILTLILARLHGSSQVRTCVKKHDEHPVVGSGCCQYGVGVSPVGSSTVGR